MTEGAKVGVDQPEQALHSAIMLVDIERFGDPARTNTHQLVVRQGLYRALEQAFAEAGVEWRSCTTEDRGDGALILVSPQVPKIRLVDQLPNRLTVALRRHNAACSPEARIRLRVALHAGEIHRDPHGFVGDALNFGFRLLDSAALRTALSASTDVMALIVSDWIYREVVRHDPAAEPGSYQQVRIAVKETDAIAWIRTPDHLVRTSGAGDRDVVGQIHSRLASTWNRPTDVVAVTAHNLDYIHKVDLIAADHEAAVEEPMPHAGGSGANTATGLALLGLRSSAMGAIVDDADGVILEQALHNAMVDTSMVLSLPSGGASRTGRTLVFTDNNGRRLIYVYPGANELFAKELDARGQREAAIRSLVRTRILHMTSFTGVAERKLQEDMAAALDPDTVLSFTPGSLYARLGADRLGRILSRANLLFLYEQQLDLMLANSSAAKHIRPNAKLTDKLGYLFEWRRRKNLTEPLVIVIKKPVELTHSGQPSEYLNIACGHDTLDEFIRAESCSLAGNRREVVDGTGAGDALVAGLIFGLVRQRPLNECADIAFIMAMAASSAIGARTQLPEFSELGDRWATYLSPYSAPAWLAR